MKLFCWGSQIKVGKQMVPWEQSTNSSHKQTLWEHNFKTWGQSHLHQKGQHCRSALGRNEVIRRQDTQAWTRPVHVTLQASGHSGGGGGSYIFMRNPLDSSASKSWNLGEGHLGSAAAQVSAMCLRPQNFLRKAWTTKWKCREPPHAGDRWHREAPRTHPREGRQFSRQPRG